MIWRIRIHWSAFMRKGKTKFKTLKKSWIKRKFFMRKRDNSLISYRQFSYFKIICNSKKPEELPLLARYKKSRSNLRWRQRIWLKIKSATLTKKYNSENYRKLISRLNDWFLNQILSLFTTDTNKIWSMKIIYLWVFHLKDN